MINADMRLYDYFTIGANNAYGQPQIPTEDSAPTGKIVMCIYTISQAIADNIKYSGANYIGLTKQDINDSYIISYQNKRLKVLYVNSVGRYKQVYLADI